MTDAWTCRCPDCSAALLIRGRPAIARCPLCSGRALLKGGHDRLRGVFRPRYPGVPADPQLDEALLL